MFITLPVTVCTQLGYGFSQLVINGETSCYKLYTQSKIWDEAQTYCKNRGTAGFNFDLVTVDSQEEMDFIRTTVCSGDRCGAWIGLKKPVGLLWDRAIWNDDTKIDDGYKYWLPGHPSNKVAVIPI